MSNPSGAQVVNVDDGSVMGVTPLTLSYKGSNSDRQYIPVRLMKEGYYDKVASFWLSMRHTSQQAAENEPKIVQISLDKKGQRLSTSSTDIN